MGIETEIGRNRIGMGIGSDIYLRETERGEIERRCIEERKRDGDTAGEGKTKI